jgi:hypothetical protein
MTTALWLMAVQGAIGAFDTVYYHEWRARLPRTYAPPRYERDRQCEQRRAGGEPSHVEP